MSNTKTTPSSIVPAAAEIVDSKPPNGTSKNALTHGVYAQEIVIDGESVEEFNNLHESLGDELNPEGASEQACVSEIVQLHWTQRRLIRDFAQSKGMRSSSPLLQEKEPIVQGTMKDAKAKIQQLTEVGIMAVLSDRDPKAALSPAQREVLKTFASGPGGAVIGFDQLCPDLERFLKLLAMIGTRIEKAMSRLIAYKEYKRQYGRGVVNEQKNPSTTAAKSIRP